SIRCSPEASGGDECRDTACSPPLVSTMISFPAYPRTVMPPFSSDAFTVAGRDGSVNGTVTCSGESCPKHEMPHKSAKAAIIHLLMIFLFLEFEYRHSGFRICIRVRRSRFARPESRCSGT